MDQVTEFESEPCLNSRSFAAIPTWLFERLKFGQCGRSPAEGERRKLAGKRRPQSPGDLSYRV